MPNFTKQELNALYHAAQTSLEDPSASSETAKALKTAMSKIRPQNPETPLSVQCKKRPDGSAWISVEDPFTGAHYQCDFYGDVDAGPRRADDFAYDPPPWVIEGLGLQANA